MTFRIVLGAMKCDLGAVGWGRELWCVSREGGGAEELWGGMQDGARELWDGAHPLLGNCGMMLENCGMNLEDVRWSGELFV